METGSWKLMLLVVLLPYCHQLELPGSRFVPKEVSDMYEKLSGVSPFIFKDELNEDKDTEMEEGLGGMVNEQMWRSMMEDVMNETDSMDDTIFEEGEEDLTFRVGVPETVDCYGLPELISRPLRFLFRTDRKETVNTRYFLSTRNHRARVEIKSTPDFNLLHTSFEPKNRTVFIIHGFMSHGSMEWVLNMTDAILDRDYANVIAVDWSGGGGSWMYWRAVANTRVTGAEVTKMIKKMMELGLNTSNVHLIGHSLGAHICSYIASHVGGVARITGLDPAQPCFNADSPDIRLDPSDADFIDVIHTNGKVLEKVGLGLPQPIGHVDFYPNGGAKQPGCSPRRRRILLPILNHIKNKIEKSICSHGRSYMFFIESIKAADKCSFWGHRWDRKTGDAQASIQAPCNIGNCTEMGLESDIFPARGSFYVPTQAHMPYCVEDPRTDNEMVKSLNKLYNRAPRIDRAKRRLQRNRL
ncbi:pancreatic triacylglycerol lipase-like [Periplaneta americana]|uniref:pancreatic triacylglycerol lipase-like n=1 Tax=Periplaneta americana TaxID=6978 RepID=UPI0037E6FDD3